MIEWKKLSSRHAQPRAVATPPASEAGLFPASSAELATQVIYKIRSRFCIAAGKMEGCKERLPGTCS